MPQAASAGCSSSQPPFAPRFFAVDAAQGGMISQAEPGEHGLLKTAGYIFDACCSNQIAMQPFHVTQSRFIDYQHDPRPTDMCVLPAWELRRLFQKALQTGLTGPQARQIFQNQFPFSVGRPVRVIVAEMIEGMAGSHAISSEFRVKRYSTVLLFFKN
ncbi:MAG: hypothetical protein H7Y05_13130 [Steroidobacteraceae bacterium]|nr:hypothetical protein [Deltaproteobacteria bacterium]